VLVTSANPLSVPHRLALFPVIGLSWYFACRGGLVDPSTCTALGSAGAWAPNADHEHQPRAAGIEFHVIDGQAVRARRPRSYR
jgi:hypothetical protein